MGFGRFGELGWLDATTDEAGWPLMDSCDFRLLLGDSVWIWVLADLLGEVEFGPEGVCGLLNCGLGSVAVAVAVEVGIAGAAVELDILGPDTWAARKGTMGSKGSMGEY